MTKNDDDFVDDDHVTNIDDNDDDDNDNDNGNDNDR